VTQRPRIAHVITRMILGGAQETVLLAAALAERVAPVVLTGPQTGPEGSLLDQCQERGVEVVLVPELVREVGLRKDLAAVPAPARALREVQAELVHTHSSKAGIVGRIAAQRAALPAVHTVHGWPLHAHQSTGAPTRQLRRHGEAAPLERTRAEPIPLVWREGTAPALSRQCRERALQPDVAQPVGHGQALGVVLRTPCGHQRCP